jgi:hypothetical protein
MALSSGSLTCGNSGSAIVYADGDGNTIYIGNNSGSTIFLGNASVTTAIGVPLATGGTLRLDLAGSEVVYGVFAAGTGTISYLKVG